MICMISLMYWTISVHFQLALNLCTWDLKTKHMPGINSHNSWIKIYE